MSDPFGVWGLGCDGRIGFKLDWHTLFRTGVCHGSSHMTKLIEASWPDPSTSNIDARELQDPIPNNDVEP